MYKTDIEKTGKILRCLVPTRVVIYIPEQLSSEPLENLLRDEGYSILRVNEHTALAKIESVFKRGAKVLALLDNTFSNWENLPEPYSFIYLYPNSATEYAAKGGNVETNREIFAQCRAYYEDRIFVTLV